MSVPLAPAALVWRRRGTLRRSLRTLDAVMFRFLLFLIAVHAAIPFGLVGLLSGHEWVGRVVPALLGRTLIGIGNLLPRMPQNLAIGIRTSRTIADRVVWMRMNRLAGYITVAVSSLILLAAIAAPSPIAFEPFLPLDREHTGVVPPLVDTCHFSSFTFGNGRTKICEL